MSEDVVTITYDDIARWANEITARVKGGEFDPERWPPDMRALAQKIWAAVFLMHEMGQEPTCPWAISMSKIREIDRKERKA